MPIDTNAAKTAASILGTFGPLTAEIPVAGPYVAIGMQAGAIIAEAFANSAISVEEAKAKALASVADLIDQIAALPAVIAEQHADAINAAVDAIPSKPAVTTIPAGRLP